jgi:hypothetical protein
MEYTYPFLFNLITKCSMALPDLVQQLFMRQQYNIFRNFHHFHLHWQWKYAMHFLIKIFSLCTYRSVPYLCLCMYYSVVQVVDRNSFYIQARYLTCYYVTDLLIHIISEKLYLEPNDLK